MRALIINEFAPYTDQAIGDIAPPKLVAGHVRLDIKAGGVNFPDILMVQGQYQIKPPFPFVAGAECAGVVSEIGDGVRGFNVGDRVAALPGTGCFAQQVVVPATSLIKISDKMSFEEAAGFTMVYATSYHALKQRSDLKAGETLLVLGAAGGVGLAAVEIGKAMGATVIAAASTQEKLEVCKAHGADHLINYTTEDLKTRAKELSGGSGVDVVYDPVGDKFAEPAVRAMTWGGRYLVVGFAAGDIPRVPFNLMLLKSADVRGVHWGAWIPRNPKQHVQNMADLMAMYEAGTIKPRVSSSHELEDFKTAFSELSERRAMGKVVLKIS